MGVMGKLHEAGSVLGLSPRAGRGRAALADRVRGSLRALNSILYSLIEAPHPNPLPARAGRGSRPRSWRQQP
jgi:hypothetical protein